MGVVAQVAPRFPQGLRARVFQFVCLRRPWPQCRRRARARNHSKLTFLWADQARAAVAEALITPNNAGGSITSALMASRCASLTALPRQRWVVLMASLVTARRARAMMAAFAATLMVCENPLIPTCESRE